MMYHVVWEADIWAESDKDAADVTIEMICDPDAFPPIFEVGEKKNKTLDFTKYKRIEVSRERRTF
jgi:hypothetical protein